MGSVREPRLDAAAEGWLDAQRAAFDTMRDAVGVPTDEADVAEGYRWVTRIASLALNWFVERSDPEHPQLFQLQDEYRKLLVDNPDVRYLFAVLDDSRTYRLTGTRGEAAYVGLTFGTPIGQPGAGGRTGTLRQVHLDQFPHGPDGRLEILFVPERAEASAVPAGSARPGRTVAVPENVIVLPAGTGQLAVRETFFDRAHDRPADLGLELVGELRPPVLRPSELAANLEMAGLFTQFVVATAVQMWQDTANGVNHFGGTAGAHHVESQEDEVRSHSDADMTYHGGRWVLGEGQALEITVREPERPFLYWGLTIASPWMESYDYRYTTTTLNCRTAQRSADGSWRVILAPGDPGRPNWLDTGGRREGYMIVRWVLADAPPHPTCALIDL